MRGREEEQAQVMLGITPDALVPEDHPIRRIRAITDVALKEMSPVLGTMYSGIGRPSIAPERLLKASILMALYSIRSERQFCERLQYDLLFKWFLNMNIASPAFDHASFSKNRERLLKHHMPSSSSRRWSRKQRRPSSFPTTTSPSMARCCRRGPRSRA